jgi:lipoprotein-anchoring transpeptidase ErfK/SrfK
VFVGRRFTGEIFQQTLMDELPDRDWILTRILWLSGLERGKNRLGDVDTMRRYIYIHGAPDNLISAQPSSHGCIRMLNEDVIDLFERTPIGTLVSINE